MDELKQLLIKARQEIIQLRRSNEIISSQMDVVHIFAAALGLRRDSQGMTIDIAWEIERKLEELEKEEKSHAR